MASENFDISRYSSQIQKFCRLPKPDPFGNPIDYRQEFSLTENDIPTLLELAEWVSAPDTKLPKEFYYTPCHAWLALGQFASPSLLTELLDVINKLNWDCVGDGYVFISHVLARSAVDSLPQLIAAFQDEKRHDSTRILIIQTFENLKKDSKHREMIVQTLIDELSKLQIGRRSLYAEIICLLLNCDVRDAIPLIEKAYSQGLSQNGDFAETLSIRIRTQWGENLLSDPSIATLEEGLDEIRDIIDAFRMCGHTKNFPHEAVAAARKHRDVIIPSLIEQLRGATAYARYGVTDVNYMGAVFATHLLSEFQVKEALPYFFESLSMTEEKCDNLYVDDLFVMIPCALHRLIGDDISFYSERIGNPNLPPTVRISLINALPYLVKDGTLNRNSYTDLLRRHLRLALDETSEKDETAIRSVISSITNALIYCGSPSDIPLVEEAFEKDRFLENYISREDAIDVLKTDGQKFEADIRANTDYDCSDVTETIGNWSWLQKEKTIKPSPTKSNSEKIIDLPSFVQPILQNTHLQNTHLVGRNDLCPCGSGKKYKKCCMPK